MSFRFFLLVSFSASPFIPLRAAPPHFHCAFLLLLACCFCLLPPLLFPLRAAPLSVCLNILAKKKFSLGLGNILGKSSGRRVNSSLLVLLLIVCGGEFRCISPWGLFLCPSRRGLGQRRIHSSSSSLPPKISSPWLFCLGHLNLICLHFWSLFRRGRIDLELLIQDVFASE